MAFRDFGAQTLTGLVASGLAQGGSQLPYKEVHVILWMSVSIWRDRRWRKTHHMEREATERRTKAQTGVRPANAMRREIWPSQRTLSHLSHPRGGAGNARLVSDGHLGSCGSSHTPSQHRVEGKQVIPAEMPDLTPVSTAMIILSH